MFTGIIREVGSISSKAPSGSGYRLGIDCPKSVAEISAGDSVAVNGVCLTATEVSNNGFLADLSSETLRLTTFDDLSLGSPVNIELPLAASGRLDGHIVQGHVDGNGALLDFATSGDGWTMKFSFPSSLERYIVQKGSIAVDGISLTVAELFNDAFSVAVISHTYENTRLKHLHRNDMVNLEVDILAKYVERMLNREHKDQGITEEFLSRHGFGAKE